MIKLFFLLLSGVTAFAAAPAVTNKVAAPVLPQPTFANVHYGDHERHVLDFWQAKSDQPTPVLVHIHGGGWRGGDKSSVSPKTLDFMLAHGVSVAAINYRYSQIAKLPAPVHDAAHSIQFIRSKAKEWNIRKDRIAAVGGSAGGCTTLWLAYHDDLADPKSSDPVARESTRLCSGVCVAGQTSIDPKVVVPWVGEEIMKHGMFWAAVGATNRAEATMRYSDFQELFHEFSPINHISAGDPPVLLLYAPPTPLPATNPGIAIHHSMLGQKLKEVADKAGLECPLIHTDDLDGDSSVVHDFLLRRLTKSLRAPTMANVRYGEYDRNFLDFWQAKSSKPTPLLFYIHGGGWRGGDKSVIPQGTLEYMLSNGISVASINYRYSDKAKLPAPVHDAARALEFVRSKAEEWNLRKDRIAAMGASAGACTTLWLAYHDDMAKPASADPLERESTRLCAGVGVSGQTSIDPQDIVPWVGEEIMNHGMIWRAVGATNKAEVRLRYPEYRDLYHDFSPINHISNGDPPVLLFYATPTPLPAPNASIGIHHAMLGQKLKEKADNLGVPCDLEYADKADQDALVVSKFLVKNLKQ